MVTYLLKKSYQLKDLKDVKFKDLWGDQGIFTTMWIFGKPLKILFFDNHIKNLIKSLKKYGIKKRIFAGEPQIHIVVNTPWSPHKSLNSTSLRSLS